MGVSDNNNKRQSNALVDAATGGDRQAFITLVKRLEPRVAATIYGFLGDCPEAEDVGQETFIRLFRSLARFRGESSIETYVTRIAINLSLNELKRQKHRSNIFTSLGSEFETNTGLMGDATDAQDTRQLVQRALSQLPDKFRAVLVLRLMDGYSVKETADILEIPAGTVLSRLARAQIKFRQAIKKLEEKAYVPQTS